MTGSENAETMFLPASRANTQAVHHDFTALKAAPFLVELLNAVPDVMMVLNAQRQIVYANAPLLRMLGFSDVERVLGLRPGEALNCQHAYEMTGGCGATAFCRYCGAAHAILRAQQGAQAAQDCRILRRDSIDALELRVWATPLAVNGVSYTVFALLDTSEVQRLHALERVFFHDILNTAGIILGVADLLALDNDPIETGRLHKMLSDAASRLITEIEIQRDFMAAENGELQVRLLLLRSLDVLHDLVNVWQGHEAARGKTLHISDDSVALDFVSDLRLLERVLGNLIKNALEASCEGDAVTVGCHSIPGRVEFRVHNAGFMPPAIQSQVFKRSFSTKGLGRGIGTYSVKLLTERYLKGRVSFTSDTTAGTLFFVSLPRSES